MRASAEGLDALQRDLAAIGGRLTPPLRPLMNLLAQDWAATFQRRILERELDLPEPHPATVKIRAYYGHDGKPRLFRDGGLVHSIAPLEIGDTYADVGTPVEFAGVLIDGGTIVGPRGPRTVQPHPFLVLDDELLEDTAAMIADYVVEGESGLA